LKQFSSGAGTIERKKARKKQKRFSSMEFSERLVEEERKKRQSGK
jgi:hypothetical protein